MERKHKKECNTMAGECNTMLREDNTMLREDNTMLREDNTMLRENKMVSSVYNPEMVKYSNIDNLSRKDNYVVNEICQVISQRNIGISTPYECNNGIDKGWSDNIKSLLYWFKITHGDGSLLESISTYIHIDSSKISISNPNDVGKLDGENEETSMVFTNKQPIQNYQCSIVINDNCSYNGDVYLKAITEVIFNLQQSIVYNLIINILSKDNSQVVEEVEDVETITTLKKRSMNKENKGSLYIINGGIMSNVHNNLYVMFSSICQDQGNQYVILVDKLFYQCMERQLNTFEYKSNGSFSFDGSNNIWKYNSHPIIVFDREILMAIAKSRNIENLNITNEGTMIGVCYQDVLFTMGGGTNIKQIPMKNATHYTIVQPASTLYFPYRTQIINIKEKSE